MTADFDYKKYSLEQLDNWMHDAMSSGGATPQEIYDVIVGVVKDNYYTYKQQTSQAYELLALLNGNGKGHLSCDKNDQSEECKKSWTSFWEDSMPPWGHSDMESFSNYYPHPDQPVYTEEELNAMCDKAASDSEKEQCREYNLREAEYYDKRAKLDAEYTKAKIEANSPYNDGWTQEYYQKIVNQIEEAGGYEWIPESPKEKKMSYDEAISAGWTMTADGFWIKENKKKWILPVEEAKDVDTDQTDYFVSFPDDLLEAAKLKEGDQVEWIDQGDGSYMLRKVTKSLGMDEC